MTTSSPIPQGSATRGPAIVVRGKPTAAGPSGHTAAYLALRHRIEWCESRLDPTAQNAHSTASGIAQFLDSTWHSVTGLAGSARDYPLAVQQAAFDKLYALAGTSPWAASRSCWGR